MTSDHPSGWVGHPLLPLLHVVGRRLRQDGASLLMVSVIVLLTGALLSGIPRFIDQVTRDGLRVALEGARPAERSVRVTEYVRGPSGDSAVWLRERATGTTDKLPDLLVASGSSVDQVVDTGSFDVFRTGDEQSSPFELVLRVQPGVIDHVVVTEGRLPGPSDETIDVDQSTVESVASMVNVSDEVVLEERPVVEIAIGEGPAADLGLGVGDEVVMFPQRTRVGFLFGPPGPEEDAPIVARVVGILDLDPFTNSYWFGDARLHHVGVELRAGGPVPVGAALVDSSEITRSFSRLNAVRSEVRVHVPTDRLAAAGHGAVTAAVDTIEETFESTPIPGRPAAASTGLDRLVENQLAQRSVAITMISVAGLAVLGISGAAILVVSVFLSVRRRAEVALLLGRGITRRQLAVLSIVEASIVVVPSCLLGWTVGVTVVEGRGVVSSGWMSATVGLVAMVTMVTATLPDVRHGLTRHIRTREEAGRPPKARLVAEIVVVALALLGLAAIMNRPGSVGVTPDGTLNPVVLGAPALVGLAVAVVVLRVYRYPLRLLAKVANRLRGLVAVTAIQRVERNPTATALPLLILSVGVATTVFTAVVVTSIGAGQSMAAWQDVGADARVVAVEGGPLPTDALDLPAGTAAAATRDSVFVRGGGISDAAVNALLVDAEDYQSVVSDTPLQPLPALLTDTLTDTTIPIVASTEDIAGDRLAMGDRLTHRFGSLSLEAEVVALADSFPNLPEGSPWIVASRDHVTQLVDRELPITELLIRNPSMETLDAEIEGVEVISRKNLEAQFREAPLVAGTTRSFAVASIYTAILVAITITAGIVTTGRNRGRDLSYLRTMGMSQRQAAATTAVELTLPTLVGVLTGIGSGLVVARITTPTLNLNAFYDQVIPTVIAINPDTIIAITTAAIALVVIAAVGASIVLRRQRALDVLRVGNA